MQTLQGPSATYSGEGCFESGGTKEKLVYLVGFIVDNANLALALAGLWKERSFGRNFWRLIYHQVRA